MVLFWLEESVRLWSEQKLTQGAQISVIPTQIGRKIGAVETGYFTNLVGYTNEIRSKKVPLVVAQIYFPSVKKRANVLFAMDKKTRKILIGMNILSPLGIIPNPKTGKLEVKNEIWEAFKTLSGTGVVIYGAIKVTEAVIKEIRSTKNSATSKIKLKRFR